MVLCTSIQTRYSSRADSHESCPYQVVAAVEEMACELLFFYTEGQGLS